MDSKQLSKYFNGQASSQFYKYFILWIMAWLAGTILTLTLFLRGTPYSGDPYVIDLWHYLPHAIYYMTYGISVITLPFMLASLFVNDSHEKRRGAVLRTICAVLLALSLLYQHIDNEILPFAIDIAAPPKPNTNIEDAIITFFTFSKSTLFCINTFKPLTDINPYNNIDTPPSTADGIDDIIAVN